MQQTIMIIDACKKNKEIEDFRLYRRKKKAQASQWKRNWTMLKIYNIEHFDSEVNCRHYHLLRIFTTVTYFGLMSKFSSSNFYLSSDRGSRIIHRNWLRSEDYFNSLIQYAACKNSVYCDLKNRVKSRLPRFLGKTYEF